MWYAIYTFGFALSLIALSPYFAYQAFKHKKYLGSLRRRLGWSTPTLMPEQPTIWIHAVSVGETLAVVPLVRRLHERVPGRRLVFSTTTMTGQTIARQRLSDWAEVITFPLDFPFSVRRWLDAVQPSLVIIVETEIWPNFLRACHRRGVPVIMINGRTSNQSFRGYRLAGRMMARVLAHFRLLLVQSQRDADRLLALGAPPDRVRVTGNLKYDLQRPDTTPKLAELEARLGLGRGRLLVAGSTARGEEKLLLDAFVTLLQQPELRDIRLLIAPRHPERFDEVAALIEETGLPYLRRSRAEATSPGSPCHVILLDTMGELAAVYKAADIVFVGGSLVPVGGHNILEPALFGKPILVGPFTSNFQAIVDEFAEQQALLQLVASNSRTIEQQLVQTLRSLLLDAGRRQALGRQARRLLQRNRGATARTLAEIERVLGTVSGDPAARATER